MNQNGDQNELQNEAKWSHLALLGPISVAYGNIPAPGLGRQGCKRKSSYVGGANGKVQVMDKLGRRRAASSFTSSVTAAGVRAVPTYNAASLAELQLLVSVPCLRATLSSSFTSSVTAAGVRALLTYSEKNSSCEGPCSIPAPFWLHFSSIWLPFGSI